MEIDSKCRICPRNCNIDRNITKGYCKAGSLPRVAKAFLHMWEEPCISGTKGSGTVFFSGCNLRCIYCQNSKISHGNFGKEISIEHLAELFLSLQSKGAHNINLVNPTHYVRQIRESLTYAGGLKVPVVYNSNGYESRETLQVMEGFADIYLPDFKYLNNETGRKYSNVDNYFEIAASAITEMYRQVGGPVFDEEGIIKKGLIIRHLILPGKTEESIKVLDWMRQNLPGDIYVSLMSQYLPCYKAKEHPEINRRIIRKEYERVINHFYRLGFENGYIQERDSAEETYIPEFDLEGI